MKPAVLAVALSLIVPATSFAAPRSARRALAVRPAPTGRAARAPSQRAAEPLHLQLARAVFPHERWERLVSKASLELTQQLAVASQGHFQLDPDFADHLRREYERMAPYEELIGTQARILDRQYTATEQKQLLAFYRSPLGKKSVLLIHDLTTYSDQEMQQKVHAGIGDALTRLKPLVHPVPDGAAPDDAPADGATAPGEAAAPEAPAATASDDAELREL
jgi:hypothetical protein